MNNPLQQFEEEKKSLIKNLGKNQKIKKIGLQFARESSKYKYTYNFNWLGQPIIQFPQDIVAVQEIIWSVKPDLIIETGIAHGGSLILSASILELIGGDGLVVGVDIDIRDHNRQLIEKHPLFKRIKMIEGSSIDPLVIDQLKLLAKSKKRIMVLLDSNHSHDHVLQELRLYSLFVTKDNYLVVFDTITEYLPKVVFANRPWGHGNNPLTAVKKFLKENKNFIVDKSIEDKLVITASPGGYLKRIS